ncbi:MAG: acyl-CoA desaturase [Bacteroidota bacterium]|nr:acyl-CoA desaturase [Bacteroidota bacterium]
MIVKNVKFNNPPAKEFVRELKAQVNAYFEDNNLKKTANAQMIIKTISLLGIYFGAYLLILLTGLSVWYLLGFAVIMGLAKAGIGFSIAHDAIHGSYSSNKTVNKILGFSMNLIGGSSYVWSISHNIVHHTYTNIHTMDEDLDVTTYMRLSPNQPRMKIHRFQHLYFPLVYSLATFFWVFVKDYKKLLQPNIGPFEKKHDSKDVWETIIFKLIYYAYTIVIPLLLLPIAWWQFLIGFMLMHMVAGFTLGIIFQLAHVVEETEHFTPEYEGTMENAWAVHQLRTTANFGMKSKLLTWYVGGLNYQVEHHLFPNICSIHYPAISGIVESVAKNYNVPYYFHKTFSQAVASHVKVLVTLGKEPAGDFELKLSS